MRNSFLGVIAMVAFALPAFAQPQLSSQPPDGLDYQSVRKASSLVHFPHYTDTKLGNVTTAETSTTVTVNFTALTAAPAGTIITNVVVHKPVTSCAVKQNGSAPTTLTPDSGNSIPIRLLAGIYKSVKVEVSCKLAPSQSFWQSTSLPGSSQFIDY